jgi:hypothetical protein
LIYRTISIILRDLTGPLVDIPWPYSSGLQTPADKKAAAKVRLRLRGN